MKSAKLGFLVFFFLLSSAVAFSAKDPSDYPLKVEILSNHWDRYRPYPRRDPYNFLYRVTGVGNLMDGASVHAIDFKYTDMQVIRSNARNQTYPARWKKPQHELEVLAPDIGHEGKYLTCDMATSVREGVYERGRSGVTEISQADYQARKAKAVANAASQAATPSAAVSKISVTSNPASAEIDVDGEFMGTTPSVLQLDVGEHTIALHKAGFKIWQRKMKVVAGEIKLSADLEPEAPL